MESADTYLIPNINSPQAMVQLRLVSTGGKSECCKKKF